MLADDIRVQGWRLGVLVLVVFAAIATLLSRLWNVQVVNSDAARAKSEVQTTVRARIAPVSYTHLACPPRRRNGRPPSREGR